jgi:GNAT superfamily N-acetyltransferase
VDAARGSHFIDHELAEPLPDPAWRLGTALIAPRTTHTRRLGVVVLGEPDDVRELAQHVHADGFLTRIGAAGATVQRTAFEAFSAVVPLTTEGGDWEWLCTHREPAPVASEDRLVSLSEDQIGDIAELLDVANPRTDARPFQTAGQVWLGVRDEHGRLLACGVKEPNLAGTPTLAGITVHPRFRGTGLGLAVTAGLTREAVREHGVCTLGLYSDNDLARRLYHGLGYGQDHLWSSRRLAAQSKSAAL